ncbi:MAG: hypothetical protein V3R81_04345 [Gammaproteobacteria bacterium]
MPRITVDKRGRSIEQILLRLNQSSVRKAIIPGAAAVVQKLVKKQFVTGVDPYGNRWKRKKVNDGRPVLTGKTRNLRRDISKIIGRSGFGVKVGTDYASFHQDGTKNMPQRKIVPDFADMPKSWKRALRPIVTVAITKLIR